MGPAPDFDTDAVLEEVVRRERLLADPAVRRDAGRVRELLHPDFQEYGASGRRWDRDSITEAMAEAPVGDDHVDIYSPTATLPAEDVALLTYLAHTAAGASLRSSVWVRVGQDWRLRFHQGTPTRGEAAQWEDVRG